MDCQRTQEIIRFLVWFSLFECDIQLVPISGMFNPLDFVAFRKTFSIQINEANIHRWTVDSTYRWKQISFTICLNMIYVCISLLAFRWLLRMYGCGVLFRVKYSISHETVYWSIKDINDNIRVQKIGMFGLNSECSCLINGEIDCNCFCFLLFLHFSARKCTNVHFIHCSICPTLYIKRCCVQNVYHHGYRIVVRTYQM